MKCQSCTTASILIHKTTVRFNKTPVRFNSLHHLVVDFDFYWWNIYIAVWIHGRKCFEPLEGATFAHLSQGPDGRWCFNFFTFNNSHMIQNTFLVSFCLSHARSQYQRSEAFACHGVVATSIEYEWWRRRHDNITTYRMTLLRWSTIVATSRVEQYFLTLKKIVLLHDGIRFDYGGPLTYVQCRCDCK